MFTRKGTFALLALACASSGSLGAAAEAAKFELGSYVNGPGGKAIAAHDYAGAIKSATTAGASFMDPLVAASNLCVAYTATGAFPEAREPCDLAVTLARREDAISARAFRSATLTSRALSNRGVLRALNGDSVGAASDLRAATKLSAPWAAAERNLAYLESSPTHRVALADGGAE
jgi:hypothetical protein